MEAETEGGVKGDGAVSAESLRRELLALAGVADAQVETTGEAPTGVHIRLVPDTDAQAVRSEIQRILAAHGMRSRVAVGPPEEPPPAPIAVSRAPALEPAPASSNARIGLASGLVSVRVEEGASGVMVSVAADDGRTETLEAPATEEGLTRAVIAAVGTLLQGAAPEVVAVEWTKTGGSETVTVVIDGTGGARSAGASVVAASRAYAVGRATWQALRAS
jgi:hypothetical protein